MVTEHYLDSGPLGVVGCGSDQARVEVVRVGEYQPLPRIAPPGPTEHAEFMRKLRRLDQQRVHVSIDGATPRELEPQRRLKLSAARKAQLKLQGLYIGHTRTLPARAKAHARQLLKTKGVRAAITWAKTRQA